MQRDTHLCFKEIHDSGEALLASVAEIEALALVPANDDQETSFSLRLLSPVEPWTAEKFNGRLELTEPKVICDGDSSPKYIAVSYTWAHSQRLEGYEPLPEYSIRDTLKHDTSSRPPRCHIMVLHRAIQFARARNCHYIWIDQECINQENPENIEGHLQVMHRIFERSHAAVAIISQSISDISVLRALQFVQPRKFVKRQRFVKTPKHTDILLLFGHFEVLLEDRWFKRTWTFQERQCGSDMELLIPVHPTVSKPWNVKENLVGSDIRVRLWDILDFLTVHDSVILAKVPPPASWELRSHYSTPFQDPPRELVTLHRVHCKHKQIFSFMERCENLVVADRLAIYANICQFRAKLATTLLRDTDYSLSTCFLVLHMANMWSDKSRRKKAYADLMEVIMRSNFKSTLTSIQRWQRWDAANERHV